MVFFKGDIMKNTVLFSILIIAIMVMAGAFVYFQVQKTSGYPDYHVNVYLNYTKGNITVDYGHNSINSIVVPSKAWFNVSLKAYSNYSYSFYQNNTPLYFNYTGLINSGFYTGFLDKNVTVSLNFMGTDLNVPDIHKFNITLTGVPSGSGYYQQLLTISNPSQYGINKAGSNIQFSAPNGTLLYAWEQSINSTSMQVWVKNYYGNSVIDMQVLPSFENLFSATGYLGQAPIFGQPRVNDNGYLVFQGQNSFYDNFHNLSGFSTFAGGNYVVNNGITERGYNSTLGLHSGIQLNVSLNVTAFTAYANTEWNTFNSTVIVFAETQNPVGLVDSDTSSYASQYYPYGNGNSITDTALYTKFQTEWFNFSYSAGLSEVRSGIFGYPTSYFNTTSATPSFADTSVYLRDSFYINYVFLTPKMAMPTFTIGTGNSTAFTHEIILESD